MEDMKSLRAVVYIYTTLIFVAPAHAAVVLPFMSNSLNTMTGIEKIKESSKSEEMLLSTIANINEIQKMAANTNFRDFKLTSENNLCNFLRAELKNSASPEALKLTQDLLDQHCGPGVPNKFSIDGVAALASSQFGQPGYSSAESARNWSAAIGQGDSSTSNPALANFLSSLHGSGVGTDAASDSGPMASLFEGMIGQSSDAERYVDESRISGLEGIPGASNALSLNNAALQNSLKNEAFAPNGNGVGALSFDLRDGNSSSAVVAGALKASETMHAAGWRGPASPPNLVASGSGNSNAPNKGAAPVVEPVIPVNDPSLSPPKTSRGNNLPKPKPKPTSINSQGDDGGNSLYDFLHNPTAPNSDRANHTAQNSAAAAITNAVSSAAVTAAAGGTVGSRLLSTTQPTQEIPASQAVVNRVQGSKEQVNPLRIPDDENNKISSYIDSLADSYVKCGTNNLPLNTSKRQEIFDFLSETPTLKGCDKVLGVNTNGRGNDRAERCAMRNFMDGADVPNDLKLRCAAADLAIINYACNKDQSAQSLNHTFFDAQIKLAAASEIHLPRSNNEPVVFRGTVSEVEILHTNACIASAKDDSEVYPTAQKCGGIDDVNEFGSASLMLLTNALQTVRVLEGEKHALTHEAFTRTMFGAKAMGCNMNSALSAISNELYRSIAHGDQNTSIKPTAREIVAAQVAFSVDGESRNKKQEAISRFLGNLTTTVNEAADACNAHHGHLGQLCVSKF